MSGTKEGAARAAATNKKKWGEDFYKRIGAIGGRKSRGGGWTGNSEAARKAGAIGGAHSKRGYKYNRETGEFVKVEKAKNGKEKGE